MKKNWDSFARPAVSCGGKKGNILWDVRFWVSASKLGGCCEARTVLCWTKFRKFRLQDLRILQQAILKLTRSHLQRLVVIHFGRLGVNCLWSFLNHEDWTDNLSKEVGKKLSLLTAYGTICCSEPSVRNYHCSLHMGPSVVPNRR
jgi:hypothetical protein